MMRKIAIEQYLAGRAAYTSGVSVLDIANKCFADQERAFAEPVDPNAPPVDWQAEETASKSFLVGFASGLVDDIRKIAGGTRGGGVRA